MMYPTEGEEKCDEKLIFSAADSKALWENYKFFYNYLEVL